MTTPFEDIVKENKKLNKVIDAMEINRKKLEKPNYDNAAFQDGLLDRIQELEQQIKDIRNEVLDSVEKEIDNICDTEPMNMYRCPHHSEDEECSICENGYVSSEYDFKHPISVMNRVKMSIKKLRQKETQQGEKK